MADLDKMVDDLSGLTVIEAADLVKKLEEMGRQRGCSGGRGGGRPGGRR